MGDSSSYLRGVGPPRPWPDLFFGKNKYKETLRFGRSNNANVKLTYHLEQTYYGGMGQLPEQHKTVLLSVKNNKNLYQALQQYVTIETSAA